MMKVLVIDEMHEIVYERLQKAGFQVDVFDVKSRDEILHKVKDYEGVLVRSKTKIEQEFLDHAPKLKFVGRAGAGLDLIDIPLLKSKGIQLFHAAEGNADAVGEHTVGMILSLINNFSKADKEIRSFDWKREDNRGIELSELTVGIIGYGRMGKATAKRLKAFGCQVLTYDIKGEVVADDNATFVSLDELREKTDVLSLHIPLNENNYHFVDEAFLSSFRKNIWFINVARGTVTDLSAVIHLLNNGKIINAALDVLPNEKMKELTEDEFLLYQKLFDMPHVLLTPHVAGWSVESYRKISEVLAEKILDNILI